MSEATESEVITFDTIKDALVKAIAVANETQEKLGEEVDPIFSCAMAKQVLDKRYNNDPESKYKTLKGRYLVRDLEYDFDEEAYVLDLIFAPKISSIIDAKFNLTVLKDGTVYVNGKPEEEADGQGA